MPSFHDNLYLYLAMEYVPGGDFRSLLAESELNEEQAKLKEKIFFFLLF